MKTYKVKVNGKVYEVELEAVSESKGSITASASKKEEAKVEAPVASGSKKVEAPIAGKITAIKVNVGDTIKVGQTVAVIEAMKLENEVPSTVAGKVASINVKVGDAVANKDVLVTVE